MKYVYIIKVMKKPQFANNHFYHVFNRGTDKRKVFMDDKDYHRFLFSLRDFNDKNSSINLFRRISVSEGAVSVGSPTSHIVKKEDRESVVKFYGSCLMPNHFHLILEQLEDGGISSFMQKLGTGYTNYFNQKYERSGVLFQGKFKAVLIDKDEYLNYLKQYIYLNPLDLFEPRWKEEGLKDWRKAKKFLEEYKWTPLKNYDEYEEFLKSCKTKSKSRFEDIKEFIIE
ncbi:transposase [Patescibacteria group bacterium]